MDDANDQNNVAIEPIEYSVLAMHGAANAFAQFRFCGPRQRMATKQIEEFVKTGKIGVSDTAAELLVAIFTDFYKIGSCSRA